MLTPLVDVMFLLLIFFMLSSETSLYTLLRLNIPTVPQVQSGPVTPSSAAGLLVSIGRNAARINGIPIPLTDIAKALQAYKADGVVWATLIPTQAAQAQDIVSVIELFEAAAFAEVRLMSNPAASP